MGLKLNTLVISGIIVSMLLLLSFSSNAPNGRTGPPCDFNLCTNCHFGGGSLDGSVSVSGIPETVNPGSTYAIAVTLNNPNRMAQRAGFQMTAINSQNSGTGDFATEHPNATVQPSGTKQYFEHSNALNFPGSEDNHIEYTGTWTAPDGPDGETITFCIAGNIANGNGAASGDRVVQSSFTTVMEATNLIAEISGETNVLCKGENNGTAQVQTSGGIAPYSYLWDNGETSSMAESLDAGMHMVTVSDSNFDTVILSLNIMEPDSLILNLFSFDNISCHGFNDGNIILLTTGGTLPYEYSWSDGGSGIFRTDLEPGLYRITISDANNCIDTVSVTLTEPEPITASIDSLAAASCFGLLDGYVELSGQGGVPEYSFLWSDGFIGSVRNDLASDSYQVTLTDANNCTALVDFGISQPTEISTMINIQTDVTCYGEADGFINVSSEGGNPGYIYSWSNGMTGSSISQLEAATYTLSVTDATNCTSTLQVIIDEPDSLVSSVLEMSDPSCPGAADGISILQTIGGSSDYQYTWSDNGTGSFRTDLVAGDYMVQITDSNGCTDSLEFILNDPDSLQVIVIGMEDASCFGAANGQIQVEASGGTGTLTYLWENFIEGSILKDVPAGDYELVVSDENGCSLIRNFTISEPDAISLIGISEDESFAGANDGLATVEVEGGTPPFDFIWSNNATDSLLLDLIPGSYMVTVSDQNFCSAISEIIVGSGNCALAVNINTTPPMCNGESNGMIQLSLENAANPVTYLWSTGDTTSFLDTIPAGSYTVTVTDAVFCLQVISNIQLIDPDSLAIEIEVINTPECPNDPVGSLAVAATGGTLPYDIQWSNGVSTDTVSELIAGKYVVTLTDANQCLIIDSLAIDGLDTIPPTPLLRDTVLYADIFGQFDLLDADQIDVGSFDNCGIEEFQAEFPSFDCTYIGENKFEVLLIDKAGNIASDTVLITIRDTMPPDVFCIANLQIDNCEIFTYPPPLAFDNCGIQSVELITGLGSGSVFPPGITTDTYLITDLAGNTATCTYSIENTIDLEYSVTTNNITCYGENNGSAEIAFEGDHDPQLFFQIPDLDLSMLEAGVYYFSIEDTLNCILLDSIVIHQPDSISITSQTITDESQPGAENGSIQIELAGGSGPFTFSWTKEAEEISTNQNLENIGAGIYQLKVTDSLDCVSSCFEFKVGVVSSNINLQLTRDIEVYPNPAKDYLIIGLNKTPYKVLNIRLLSYDSKSTMISTVPGTNEITSIDIRNLPNGLYIIQFELEKEYVHQKVIILR